ncbi:MAG: NAD-dependent epimerase/dehydratase family protein [Micrococcaceae bacterium]|nr:NAD-dependent epimerase/dehydratase family protein [Micrococcaceae bacterium]
MTVLMAGCGDVGTEAGLRFAALGHRVVGWRRSPEVLPGAIEPVVADLTGELPPVPADTSIVVVAPAAGARNADAYRQVYREGLANVLNALERDGVRPERIILVSSTAVYPNVDGAWMDEVSPVDPPTATAAVLCETEELLAARAPQGTVLRLSGIYGPGRTRLIDQVRTGEVDPSVPGLYTNRIHRDDAAGAIVHLATAVDAPGPLYLGVDEEPVSQLQVLSFLAGRLGMPWQEAPSPGEPAGKRLRGDLLRASGYTYSYPSYREGYAAVLEGSGVRHP